MNEILLEAEKEIEKNIIKGIENDDYYQIWNQLRKLNEMKARVTLCTRKC